MPLKTGRNEHGASMLEFAIWGMGQPEVAI